MSPTALVTGAASGIGRACAIELARKDYDLVLWDINAGGLQTTQENVRRESPKCRIIVNEVDVADRDTVSKAFDDLKQAGTKISKVAPVAGICRMDSLNMPNPNDAALMMAVNYHGVVNVLQAAREDLQETKGAVVMIGSIESFQGGAAIHSYVAAKHALLGFCRSAAIELGPSGVRVNMVSPGTIETPMYAPEKMGELGMQWDKALRAKTPLKRLGKPEEVAKVVAFLLSEDASYVNGANVVVDGGLSV